MADLPILFSAPMVLALLAGRKTQTRRILKPHPDPSFIDATIERERLSFRPARLFGSSTHKALRHVFRPGDRLWVRETLSFDWKRNDWLYRSDSSTCVDTVGAEPETPTPDRWPTGTVVSIHMPRAISRLTLIVEKVKIERLQDISEEDAIAEGTSTDRHDGRYFVGHDDEGEILCKSPITAFAWLWNSINGEDAWQANPWVAAYTFRVIRENIDRAAA